MSDSTRGAWEIEEAAMLASDQYLARRAGFDAVKCKGNVWFEGWYVADGCWTNSFPPRMRGGAKRRR